MVQSFSTWLSSREIYRVGVSFNRSVYREESTEKKCVMCSFLRHIKNAFDSDWQLDLAFLYWLFHQTFRNVFVRHFYVSKLKISRFSIDEMKENSYTLIKVIILTEIHFDFLLIWNNFLKISFFSISLLFDVTSCYLLLTGQMLMPLDSCHGIARPLTSMTVRDGFVDQ